MANAKDRENYQELVTIVRDIIENYENWHPRDDDTPYDVYEWALDAMKSIEQRIRICFGFEDEEINF